ncbi:hypothetical protein [Burkholderia diffusa]|uniref:hypothetical protein n=1 Tax=Burkholderia diffusa TaxID=488732 RepID=UPI002AB285D3|nr:hypothetical protein [Burkholderia diffusa]
MVRHEDAVIAKGIRAWSRIKSTVAEQRQLWREVGEALLVGRRLFPSNNKFGAWCVEKGFDMDRRYRAAAMWVAENWQAVVRNTDNASDPIQLQKDHAAATESAVLGDKALDTPEPSVNLQAVAQQARKINALANSAAAGDETAKRHLDKKSKDFGGSVEEVVKTARAVAPELTVPADALKTLEATKREGVRMGHYHHYTQGEPYASVPERGIRCEVSHSHHAAIARDGTAVRGNTATRPNAVVVAICGSCSSSACARRLQVRV